MYKNNQGGTFLLFKRGYQKNDEYLSKQVVKDNMMSINKSVDISALKDRKRNVIILALCVFRC